MSIVFKELLKSIKLVVLIEDFRDLLILLWDERNLINCGHDFIVRCIVEHDGNLWKKNEIGRLRVFHLCSVPRIFSTKSRASNNPIWRDYISQKTIQNWKYALFVVEIKQISLYLELFHFLERTLINIE